MNKPFTTVVETLTDQQVLALKIQIDEQIKLRNLQPLDPEVPPHDHDAEGNPLPENDIPDYPGYPDDKPQEETRQWSASSTLSGKLAQLSNSDILKLHSSLHEAAIVPILNKSSSDDFSTIRLAHRQIVAEMIQRQIPHIIESPMDYDTIQAMSRDDIDSYLQVIQNSMQPGASNQERLNETFSILSSISSPPVTEAQV